MSHTYVSLKWVTIGLTHWGRATHICVNDQTIIGSDNGLAPGRRQAIIWTNDGILLIGALGTNFSEISIEILTFSFKKMRLNVSSAKWRPCCLSRNVLNNGHHLCGTNLLPEPMLTYCQLDAKEQTSIEFLLKHNNFHSKKCVKNVACIMSDLFSP